MIILKILFVFCMSILWRFGGMGAKPFGKNWRRIFCPLIYVIYIFLMKLAWWHFFGPAILILIGFLPITLIGDDLKKYGQLYWWIPVLSILHGAAVMSWFGIPLAVIHWLMVWGSNTVNFPKWHYFEIAMGLFFGLAIVLS